MPELARVRTILSGWPGAPGVCTVYLRNASGSSWSAITAQTIQDVKTAWDYAAPLFPGGMRYTVQGEVDIIDEASGLIAYSLSGADNSDPGGSSGNLGPWGTGLLVHLHTAGVRNGKHVRGRQFLIPVSSDMIDTDGTPTSAALGHAQSFGTCLASAMTYTDTVVYSKKRSSTDLGYSYLVTTATVRDTFAMLRTRRD